MKRNSTFIIAPLCLGLASTAMAVEKRKFDFVVGVDGDFKAAMAAASAASPQRIKTLCHILP